MRSHLGVSSSPVLIHHVSRRRMIATTKFGWCGTAPEYRDESVTPPTRKKRRQRSVRRQGARQVRVERTPLRGLLSKAMELVDDNSEWEDRRRHPAARR
jgi:hypothetical protein